MTAAIALFRNELRLTLRSPATIIWTVLIPIAALIVMCCIPGARQPSMVFGGLSVVTAYQPTLIVFAMTTLALQTMPTVLGGYRESGFLRRLRTTPVHPGTLLAAVLALTLVIAILVAAFLALFPLSFGLQDTGHQLLATLAAVPCAVAFLGLGAMSSSVIGNPRVAGAAGTAFAAVMWFAAGMWLPRAQFPGWLAALADWTPGGAAVSLLVHAASGTAPGWQPPVCLLVWAVLGFAVAIRTFRWE